MPSDRSTSPWVYAGCGCAGCVGLCVLLGMVAAPATFIPIQTVIVFWFDARRALALGLVLALVILLGSGEWARLSGVDACIAQTPYIFLVAFGIYGAAFLLQDEVGAAWLLYAAALWWLALSLMAAAVGDSCRCRWCRCRVRSDRAGRWR